MVPYPPLAIYFSALTSLVGHIFTLVLNHGAAGGGPLGGIWCSRGEHGVVWHVIAVCVCQTHTKWHLCLELPAMEVRSWPRLPGKLQDNLLTSNGLPRFCLSPCENQKVFLSLPLPPPPMLCLKC